MGFPAQRSLASGLPLWSCLAFARGTPLRYCSGHWLAVSLPVFPGGAGCSWTHSSSIVALCCGSGSSGVQDLQQAGGAAASAGSASLRQGLGVLRPCAVPHQKLAEAGSSRTLHCRGHCTGWVCDGWGHTRHLVTWSQKHFVGLL